MNRSNVVLCAALALMVACAGQKPEVSYPAFLQIADVPDTFLAGLPGTRAKILSSNLQSRRSSTLSGGRPSR